MQILVLLVEDNPADSRLVRTMLAEAASEQTVGFQVRSVERMAEAMAKLVEVACDVILLDLSLPDSQGLESLYRTREAAPNIPIVVLSGLGDESVALQAVREGAQDYLVKGSVDSLLLARVIQYAIERQHIEEALRESEDRFRRLAENARDVIFRYRFFPLRGFEYVSPAATSINGYSIEEHYTDPDLLTKLIHPEDHELLQPEAYEVSFRASLELRWIRKGGKIVWIEQRNVLIRDETGKVIAIEGIARDVTTRKQRERELEIITTVSSALRSATTRAKMLPIILDQVTDLLETDGAALLIQRLDSNEITVELGSGHWADIGGTPIQSGEGITGRVFKTGQPFVVNHTSDNLYPTDLEIPGELHATACVPLIAHGYPIGVLWIARREEITQAEVQIITAIADIAANAIRRAMLHEQTEQRLQRLAALRAIDQAITSSFDLRLTLRVLLEQVSSQLKVDATDVLLLEPQTLILKYAAGRGFETNSIIHSRMKLGEGNAGRAASERRPVTIPHLPVSAEIINGQSLLKDENFVSYAGVPLIAKGQVKGVLEVYHRSPLSFDPEWLDFLEALAGQAAIAIDNSELFESLQLSNMQLALAYDATIEGWSRALDQRDKETEGHSRRVTEMTIQLATAMDMSAAHLIHIRRGALLHDIGKMGIPDNILLKPGPLTDEEWVIMRKHPEFAYDLLFPIEYLRPALDIPYCHHEKWDGSGYPRQLTGEQIPLAARIFAIVDVWDALRSDRPYRPAWPAEQVREHIHSQLGKHFDPEVGKQFLQMSNGIVPH